MEFKCKVMVQTDEFIEKLEEYQKKIKDFESSMPEDPILRQAYDEPEPPEMEYGYSITRVKDDLIVGYELLENKGTSEEERTFKVYFDQSKFHYGYFISFYDDKIIEQLDKLLEKKV